MAKSKSLAKAVNAEVKQADVNTGSVEKVSVEVKTEKAPVDLPTGARSHPPQ